MSDPFYRGNYFVVSTPVAPPPKVGTKQVSTSVARPKSNVGTPGHYNRNAVASGLRRTAWPLRAQRQLSEVADLRLQAHAFGGAAPSSSTLSIAQNLLQRLIDADLEVDLIASDRDGALTFHVGGVAITCEPGSVVARSSKSAAGETDAYLLVEGLRELELVRALVERGQDPVAVAASALASKIRERASEDPDEAVFFIYREVDALLRHGAFRVCDLLLTEDFSTLKTVHLLALLSITSPARGELNCRGDFAKLVRARLSQTEGSRVEELLAGIE
jgi:hypothetical protein